MTSSRIEYKLAFWITHKVNVLFRTRYRVSIAVTITTVFEVAGMKWRAIPSRDANTEQLLDDISVEAILFSDLDRTPKRFVAAVMQLIRFRTINDRWFPNLKVVWAIVGRSEDDFDDFVNEETEQSFEPFDVVMTVPYHRTFNASPTNATSLSDPNSLC